MLLDCSACPGRGTSCQGCMVSVLLDPRPSMPADVSAAIDVLQDAGLIGAVHLALLEAPATEQEWPRVVPMRRRAG